MPEYAAANIVLIAVGEKSILSTHRGSNLICMRDLSHLGDPFEFAADPEAPRNCRLDNLRR
jgi:hypothetical protein